MTDAAPPDAWKLTVFGTIELHGADAAAAERVLVQPKHVAMLAYLAAERARRGGYQRRDRLAALFWPELDQHHARAALRRVVHQIRSTLGADTLLARGDEELALNSELISSDLLTFYDAIERSRLQAAVELYRGEMMPGFHLGGCGEFQHWLDAARTETRQEAFAAAWALAEQLEATGQLTQAGRILRKALKFSWEDERVIRRALIMLDRLGDHVGALRLFDEFSRWLRSEYDASPAPETLEVIERIRSQ